MTAKKGDKHPNHIGNKCWMNREKHGRSKLFETPTEAINKLEEYQEWAKNNPTLKPEIIKSGERVGEVIQIKYPRATTIEDFCHYNGFSYNTFYNYENKEEYKDFFNVFKYIREVLDSDIANKGFSGIFNPMLVARKLGMQEKQVIEQTTNVNTDISEKERDEIIRQLKKDV